MEEFHFTQHEVSLKVGKERSTISNYLRLFQLPIGIQKSLRENRVSMGHAKALLAIDCPLGQELLHEAILREGLSVRETEVKARKVEKKVQRNFYLEEIERKIRDRLGIRVTIEGNGKKGRVILSYANLDDIDRILSALGIEMGL
jgi:ParB family chromosome partitioning protein